MLQDSLNLTNGYGKLKMSNTTDTIRVSGDFDLSLVPYCLTLGALWLLFGLFNLGIYSTPFYQSLYHANALMAGLAAAIGAIAACFSIVLGLTEY